jgi:hypothetical protein
LDLSVFVAPEAGVVLIGVAVTVSGVILLRRAEKARRGPSVRGRVVVSRMVEQESNDDEKVSRTLYRPEVHYEYVVEGRQLIGMRRGYYDAAVNWPSYAEGVIARLPVGAEVQVFYDAADPQQALLDPDGGRMFSWGAVVGGLVVALAAVGHALFKASSG